MNGHSKVIFQPCQCSPGRWLPEEPLQKRNEKTNHTLHKRDFIILQIWCLFENTGSKASKEYVEKNSPQKNTEGNYCGLLIFREPVMCVSLKHIPQKHSSNLSHCNILHYITLQDCAVALDNLAYSNQIICSHHITLH